LHDHDGATAAEVGAGGEAESDVLAHRREPGQIGALLERGDEPFDQRARDAREEIEPVTVEEPGELSARH
jgi:hypothetical protein